MCARESYSQSSGWGNPLKDCNLGQGTIRLGLAATHRPTNASLERDPAVREAQALQLSCTVSRAAEGRK